jgi:hypothetical protein
MNNAEKFIESLESIFLTKHNVKQYNVKGCYESDNRESFEIRENDSNRSYIVKDSENNSNLLPSFKIINPNAPRNPVYLLAIDNCFFNVRYQKKRIDCLVFNNLELCFVELKLDIKSSSEQSKLDRIEDAIEQIEATINFFKDHFFQASQDFLKLGFKIYQAYIVFPSQSSYPRSSASKNTRKLKFGRCIIAG